MITPLAIFRDIPGIILAVPSNGADAVKMLRSSIREAYENGRIIVFIEPIALYMKKDLYEDKDGSWASIYPPLGEEVSLGEFKSLRAWPVLNHSYIWEWCLSIIKSKKINLRKGTKK